MHVANRTRKDILQSSAPATCNMPCRDLLFACLANACYASNAPVSRAAVAAGPLPMVTCDGVFPYVCNREGIVPEALQACLEQRGRQGRAPGLLYTVPVGQNPTGNDSRRARLCLHSLLDTGKRWKQCYGCHMPSPLMHHQILAKQA